MGPAFYIMAILGCGEADTACQQVGVEQAQYRSVDECNAATADALARHVDAAYPVVVAQCQRADSPIAQTIMPEQIDLPEPEGETSRTLRATYAEATPRRS